MSVDAQIYFVITLFVRLIQLTDNEVDKATASYNPASPYRYMGLSCIT